MDSDSGYTHQRVAVLIPCLNEEKTIAKVVCDFRRELPDADIYVFDNDSTDRTKEEAIKAGAIVIPVLRRGKGFVVQAMFEKVDADVYVIVDGDDTYPADRVKLLIQPILYDEADMSIGSRIKPESKSQFRLLNLLGNKLYLYLINAIFGTRLTDVLSGYRCINRKLLKTLPVFMTGFEVEAEMTIKALERGFRLVDVPVDLRARPEGSQSKIKLFKDGFKILFTIFALFRDYKPMTFFGAIGLILIILGLIPGFVAVYGFLKTGLVLHFPSAILSVGMVVLGFVITLVGVILHTINRRFQELEFYLRRNR